MTDKLKQNTDKTISEGKYYPLGATLTKEGVNFAIYSQYAQEVYLLLFDEIYSEPTDIIRLEHCTKNIWHCLVHNLGAGKLYGYKIKGEYNPAYGFRFNENKLLLDPYTKAITGKFNNTDNLLLGYDAYSKNKDIKMDSRDNTKIVPKGIIIDNNFDWENDTSPDIPLEKLIIYETHLKGFTAHKSSKVKFPGTYTGFIEKIPYLVNLGINAVELLPIQEFYIEDFLLQKGLTNYWGYNTVGFFAPESSYSTKSHLGCQVDEFKTLVRELHKAGIEIILDVVYNHSCEGNELGPTLSFKGLDNLTYYSLTGPPYEPFRYYMNYTGCGNSLNFSNPPVIRLVMDSLRYWIEVMHVDGFRFDLASVLGRENGLFQKCASFFDAISQDPVLNKVKLIAEPWDIGTYQVGNFPIDWSEWNGKFRDTFRKFGKGDSYQVKDLGWRISGSADLFADDGRSAYNSINFITCHDGFTLRDLVSYNNKHNEANKEDNNDGTNDNNCWNCGIEGEIDDLNIIKFRKKLIKNYICYLFFSLGTPMLLAGDEMFRTQKGNNNAYCQDNEIGWICWDDLLINNDIFTFCQKAISFMKRYAVFQNRKFLFIKNKIENSFFNIIWYSKNLTIPDWDDPENHTLCFLLNGSETNSPSETSEQYLFFIYNADYFVQTITLPKLSNGNKWYRILDTNLEPDDDFLIPGKEILLKPNDFYIANPRSNIILIGK